MDGFLSLHSLAASRGDGLHPKLLAMTAAQAQLSAPPGNVEDIALRRGETHIQSGPHPVGVPGEDLPDGVVRLNRSQAGTQDTRRAAGS